MRIDRLELTNFKKFDSLSIDLDPHFSLLIGENGIGKTSILDALSIASSIWLVEPPDPALAGSRRKIEDHEIRRSFEVSGDREQFRPHRPVVVKATGSVCDESFQWTRQINDDGTRTSNRDAKEVLARINAVYRDDASGRRSLCPITCYYGAGRAWLPSNESSAFKGKTMDSAARWAAFYDCFNERIRFSALRDWFRDETTEMGTRSGKRRPGFEAVCRSILRFVPGATAIRYNSDHKDIVLTIDGVPQLFGNLSAGQRMMVSLVADIGRRAVIQNSHLLPPDELDEGDVPRIFRETPGIVLIDELDVHLHPRWQRDVARNLKATFPALQFVCTSHSPQIIGELEPHEVRILKGNRVEMPGQCFGMDSNWILEVLQEADPMDAEVARTLNEISQLTTQRQLVQAQELVSTLRGRIGNSAALQRAASTIERIKVLGK